VLQEDKLEPPNHNFRQETKQLFESAADVASHVGREKQISMRHLIAALLLPAQEYGRLGERCTLFQNVFPAAEFATALVKHVTTSERVQKLDQLDKWSSILRRIQPETPTGKKQDQQKDLATQIDAAIASGAKTSPPVDPQNPTLADTEDDLIRQIGELSQKRAAAKSEEERRQITSYIESKKLQLEIVLGEKGGPSPNARISIPEAAMRLASEIQALDEKGVNTAVHAERVQIKAELDRKHAELVAVLGQKGSEPSVKMKAASATAQPDDEKNLEPDKIEFGGRLHLTKSASAEEATLGVEGYANVLTGVLRSADEKELCLAIFGAWGRGKTFLIDRTL